MATEILCLCQQYDLRAMFGAGFAEYPDIRLLTPDEVAMVTSIDITALGRPSATRTCDHVSRKQPNDDTEASNYDSDLSLLQA